MTSVGIDGERFTINGEPTYRGRTFRGHRIEGLLLNSRMVQATFDDFDRSQNNFMAAVSRGASWGFFDPGENNYLDGYQSPPVNWGLSTERKRAFFQLAKEMTREEGDLLEAAFPR
jgi:hypothetical protein